MHTSHTYGIVFPHSRTCRTGSHGLPPCTWGRHPTMPRIPNSLRFGVIPVTVTVTFGGCYSRLRICDKLRVHEVGYHLNSMQQPCFTGERTWRLRLFPPVQDVKGVRRGTPPPNRDEVVQHVDLLPTTMTKKRSEFRAAGR